LRDHSGGDESKALKFFDLRIRQDNPLSLLYKMGKPFLEKPMLIIAALVGSPADGLRETVGRPFGGVEHGWSAGGAEPLKERPRGVVDTRHVGKVSSSSSFAD
jgi:hypothetical protein